MLPIKVFKLILDLVQIILQVIESTSDKDADGVPLDPNYEKFSYLLSLLRDAFQEYSITLERCYEK